MVQFAILLIGIILGAFFGMTFMCCLIISKECSKDEEERQRKNH